MTGARVPFMVMRYAITTLLLLAACSHTINAYEGADAKPTLLPALQTVAKGEATLVAQDRAYMMWPAAAAAERQALADALARAVSAPPVRRKIKLPARKQTGVMALYYPTRFLETRQDQKKLVIQRIGGEHPAYWITYEPGDAYYSLMLWATPEIDSAWDRLESRAGALSGGFVRGPPVYRSLNTPTATGSNAMLREVGIYFRGLGGGGKTITVETAGALYEIEPGE